MEGNISEKKSLRKINGIRIVFLVWDRQSVRARGIAKYFGANLQLLYTSRIKHPSLFVKTLHILIKERPQIIFCQSPPITCAMVTVLYKYLFGRRKKPKIVIDIHTGAIIKPWSKTISRLVMRLANYNIVTNKELQKYVYQKYCVESLVLEDPIPDFDDILSINRPAEHNLIPKEIFKVAVVSSFAYDEPIQLVFDTACQLPDIQFYITGDKNKMDNKIQNPKLGNVIMTGLLGFSLYLELLQKVDVIIDLTTDDKTMLSGAHEAVALEQPLIVSNWAPLRRYFSKGTIYVENTPKDLMEGVMIAKSKKRELSSEMHDLRIEKIKEWNDKASKFYYLFS